MKRLDRASLLVALTEKLREKRSWAGETHLQKAAYVLERVLRVPTDFEFTLYKHGPFSFELGNELSSLRSDGFLEWEVRDERYGPSLRPGPMSKELKRQFPSAPKKFSAAIDFVSKHLGQKNVADLERLATAIYLTLDSPRLVSSERGGSTN